MIRTCRPWTSAAVAWMVVWPLLSLVWLAGCQPNETASKTPPKAGLAPAGTTFRLVVVDDPALATALGQLSGEWTGQSGYGLAVEEKSAADLANPETLKADGPDLRAGPPGPLGARKQLLPLPEATLRDTQSGWADVFSLLRTQELSWAGKPMAVPFGSPMLVCYYRADLLEKLGRKPPKTWTEYNRLAALLSERKNLGEAAPAEGQPWQGALEPLAPGWAGMTLLARAATYASYRSNFSVLFNIATMEPLIDGPPFVRALEELVAAAGPGRRAAAEAGPQRGPQSVLARAMRAGPELAHRRRVGARPAKRRVPAGLFGPAGLAGSL